MEDTGLSSLLQLFHVDILSIILLALVGFVGLNVGVFARKYLQGDQQKPKFFARLLCLLTSLAIMVMADHLLVFLAAWAAGNYLLTRLMVHKNQWQAARASGRLAGINFLAGWAALAVAFGLFYTLTGETSIQKIVSAPSASPWLPLPLLLLVLAAMTQSAIWPFHRWLLSSLNSPTPVSALMHAGLVNGGGFLLARFAPLYLQQPLLLQVLLVTGITAAWLGTFWKLMQHDIKRMLASSTLAQMGFMMVQCSLGLFPAAIAHLCWHGLFKAYLFLASGSAARQQKFQPGSFPGWAIFFLALLCGAFGAYGFAWASHKEFLTLNTNSFLVGIAWLAGVQLAIVLMKNSTREALSWFTLPWRSLPLAALATTVLGCVYGFTVHLIESRLAPLQIQQPQPLNALHITAFLLLALSWMATLFIQVPFRPKAMPSWMLKLYVKLLNASQPHPATVTAHRNHYKHV